MKKLRQFNLQITNSAWKPSTRETSQIFASKDALYMSFGNGSFIYNDIYQYTVESHSWRALPTTGIVGTTDIFNKKLGRCGHSMVIYQLKLFIFGGRLDSKQRELSNSMLIYDLRDFTFEILYPPPEVVPRDKTESCLVGRCMIVFAGHDFKRHPLNDLWAFDLVIIIHLLYYHVFLFL